LIGKNLRGKWGQPPFFRIKVERDIKKENKKMGHVPFFYEQ